VIPFVTGLLALGFFAPAIFAGQVPIFRDFVNVFIPFRLYAAHAIANGRLPLWAPEASFGVPFLANYQSAVLYPPSFIIDVIPNPVGFGLYLALHFWIAGIGMDALLRRRGLPPRARLIGAIVMMLGGVMISVAAGNHLSVVAWIPLSLAAAEDLVSKPRPVTFSWLVVLLTVQVLAGAPETFAQSAALIAAAAAWMACREHRRGWVGFALVGLAGVLALALSGVQLVPTAEYFAQTERSSGLSAEMALAQPFEPQTFRTLLAPHRLDGGIVTHINELEVPLFWSIYVGIVPLVLVMIGLATRRGRRWALVLAASVILALGDHTPVYPLLYACFPKLLGAFRYPQKFLFTAHVATSVLAAIGFAWLQECSAKLREPIHSLFGAVLLVTTLVDLWAVHQPALLFYDWQRLLDSAPAALVRQGPDARIFQYEATPAGVKPWLPHFWIGGNLRAREAELWAKLAMNVPLAYGIGFTNGFDSLSELRPSVDALLYTIGNLSLAAELRLLGNLGVRFLVGEQALEDPTLKTVQKAGPDRPWIYQLAAPAPRIYLARRFRVVSSPLDAFRAMSDESFQGGEDAALFGPPTDGDRGAFASGSLRVVEDTPESLSLEVDATGAALLVVGDSFFPGWQAEIDGSRASMLRANGGLARALPVPAGKHSITIAYRPSSFRLGLAISAAALVAFAVILGLIAGARGSRRCQCRIEGRGVLQKRYT
jgi:hypothetical protein